MWEKLYNTETIVIAVLIVLISVFLLFGTSKGRKGISSGGQVTLIMGPSGAGKTSLFYSWALAKTKTPLKTVTSQSINKGTFKEKCDTEIIDCPGHPKLNVMGLKLVPRAKRIVFLIDGTDHQAIRAAAEQVYDIFVTKGLKPSTQMLLCLNKTDDSEKCMSSETLVESLNAEIEKLRVSRAQELEGDNAIENYIGVEGEAFDILKHAPIDVTVGSASVKKGKISDIGKFLRPSN